MTSNPIVSNTKVSQIISQYPQTVPVFLQYGCPDMSRGLFKMMSKMMPLKWAAVVHRIPLDELLQKLNDIAKADK